MIDKRLYKKKIIFFCLIFAFLFSFCLAPMKAYAEIDAPMIKSWQNGKPYDLDGDPVLDPDYFPEGWCLDISQNPEGVYEYVNADGSIKTTMSVNDFLKKYDDTYKEGGEDVSASSDAGNTGVINFTATVPEDVNGTDVIIGIRNTDGDTYKIRLYSANKYAQTAFVKPGTYTITSANLDGDTAMQYQAKYSSDTQTIKKDGSGSFDIDFTGQATLQKEGTDAKSALTDSSLARRILIFVTVILIGSAIGLIIWIAYKRYKINKGY